MILQSLAGLPAFLVYFCTGLVAVVQRTDGALRLNAHLHCLGLDGVYVRDADGKLVSHELPTPSCAEVASIARRTALPRACHRTIDLAPARHSAPLARPRIPCHGTPSLPALLPPRSPRRTPRT